MERLHFDVHEGNGPPVMLLHGFLSSRAQWLANLQGLKSFCSPITVELWGHGRSPTPADTALFEPLAYIDQFELIRKELELDRWYVVGQSFGAGLTLRYALNWPDVIVGQAFCNSNSALEREDGSDRGERGKKIRELLLGGKPITDLPVHPSRAKRIPEDIKTALIEDAQLLDAHSLEMSGRITRSRLSVRNDFHTLKVPTLLINGVWEKGFQAAAAFACESLPILTEVKLEGGHAINIERAAEFNDALREHLNLSA